jgi:hypothetical protein
MRYESYGFLAARLRKEIVPVSRRRLGLADTKQVDGYIDTERLAALEGKYGLRRSSRGDMTMRSTSFDLSVVKAIASRGNGALAALDAAGSMDAREHGAGSRALATHLERFAEGRAHD